MKSPKVVSLAPRVSDSTNPRTKFRGPPYPDQKQVWPARWIRGQIYGAAGGAGQP